MSSSLKEWHGLEPLQWCLVAVFFFGAIGVYMGVDRWWKVSVIFFLFFIAGELYLARRRGKRSHARS